MTSCRYCKSPQRFNPCWWSIVNKNHQPGGGDPPCYLDAEYDDDRRAGARMRAEERAFRRRRMVLIVVVAAALIAMIALARGQDHHSNPWLKSWIPATCCVTNDCCWEISESELTPLPDDHYEVKSTGQVRKRTAYSPDGRFYRCACDYDNVNKNWVRHQGANTRCIFIPMRSAMVRPR